MLCIMIKMASNKIFLTIVSSVDLHNEDAETKKLLKTHGIELVKIKEGPDTIDKAIVEVRGGWTVIVENKLKIGELQKIISAAKKMPSALAVVGVTETSMGSSVGIRNIQQTLPVIFDSDYLRSVLPVSSASGKLNKKKVFDLLSELDKKGGLLLEKNYTSDSTYFYKSSKLIRPYVSIAKSKLFKNTDTQESYDNSFVLGKKARPITFDVDVPVFINCRDRLEPLLKLIGWLESEGLKNIILIDNDSTYRPLLEFYNSTKHRVVKTNKNYGHRAPWRSGAISVYAENEPYIVTDPDIIPLKSSHGAVKEFIRLLNKYPDYYKVGFGLKIDNLPSTYKAKEAVKKWESQFWKNELEKDVYVADIDTTFALYRACSVYAVRPALRTGGKFMAEHEPWYQNSNKPTDEYKYYLNHSRREIATWGLDEKGSAKVYN